MEEVVRSYGNCEKVENEPLNISNHPWSWVNEPMDRIHIGYFGPFFEERFSHHDGYV